MKEDTVFPIMEHLIPQTVKMKLTKEDLFSFAPTVLSQRWRRTGQTLPCGGNRSSAGSYAQLGRWTNVASTPTPSSSSRPSTNPSDWACPTGWPCGCVPASRHPCSAQCWISARFWVSLTRANYSSIQPQREDTWLHHLRLTLVSFFLSSQRHSSSRGAVPPTASGREEKKER